MSDLVHKFIFQEELSSDPQTKKVTLLGLIDEKPAIISLEKLPFSNDKEKWHQGDLGIQQVRSLDSNDVYSWNVATLKQDIASLPGAKINVIYPATETHIKKHRKQRKRMIHESADMYKKVVVPYINTMKGDRIQWVHNILYQGVEADRVVHRDDDEVRGFVLLPDMKWDRKNLETLYLVAIVLRNDIASIRDLTSDHISYLEDIRDRILDVVPKKYAVDRDQLKVYFHYQPSYYHLHIHVTHVELDLGDFGRSVLLDDVIERLKLLGPNGYASTTLSYILGEGHELWKAFKDYNKD